MELSRRFKSRVLIVDDDPRVLETTAAIVRSFGFSVRTAEDGFVALKILREVLPDIILSDLSGNLFFNQGAKDANPDRVKCHAYKGATFCCRSCFSD
jgi:DNA-binding NarL/FixJ family response regulator